MNQHASPRGEHTPGASNRLASAASPYLLQHADNPVDWYPWGEEAFRAARREDKPIFLSIGYSACHWCHVMERESFEDPEVAKLMNDTFVSIKVDREERPDIDHVYMTVCQMMTGGGGWPLTVVMTPGKQPFFAATYLPRESRPGMTGMLDLIPRIRTLWREQRDKLAQSAEQVTAALDAMGPSPAKEPLGRDVLTAAYEHLAGTYDKQYGGFGSAPKFPSPHQFFFLLRYWRRTGAAPALEMVRDSIRAMARSGTFDQLGFGFHRYATDREWRVPHFEKMLYDQALMLTACVEASQASGDPACADTARRIGTYMLRDLAAPEGGFYAAENAESEGEEGKFYVWRAEEIRTVLSEEEAKLAAATWNIRDAGNVAAEAGGHRTGANVLHRTATREELARDLALSPAEFDARLDTVRGKLLTARAQRVRPSLDDKILTDWNGLAIAALALAGRVLPEPAYTEAARRAEDFIRGALTGDDGRLLHRYRRGRAGIRAHADDYAFLVWGLIELYETTFDAVYLERAAALQDAMIEHFWDETDGGFFFTAADAEELPARQKQVYDGAAPSANSAAMLNLLRLGRLTATPSYEKKAADIGRAFAGSVRQAPPAHTMLLAAVDFALGPSSEVVLAEGGDAGSMQAMLAALRGAFLPRTVVLYRPGGPAPAITKSAPFTAAQTALDGQATAYVCRNFACRQPTTDPRRMLEMLAEE